MNSILREDLSAIEGLFETIKNEGLSYLNNIQNAPTSVINKELSTRKIEPEGKGSLAALNEFNERFREVIVASSGPRYWGYVTGGSTPASIAGDWLASVYDQNTQTIKGTGDISGLIEFETISLLLDLFGLPHDFSGGFVTGATMSNFTCISTARQWVGTQSGYDIAKDGLSGISQLKVLCATPHSSAVKSLSMLGIGSRNIIIVNCLKDNREAMDIASLEDELRKLDDEPCIIISSAGTVNSGDFDDFEAISRIRSKYNFWWHIDGAFGAFAGCSPQYRYLVKGWEAADSITVDCHKWLNVPYESAVYFINKKHAILQAETFQNSNAPYLGNTEDNFNFLNVLPENSRRLKALPVWFSLVAYGKDTYTKLVEENIHQARLFAEKLIETSKYELMVPVRLNIVAFTIKGLTDKQIDHFLNGVNSRGKVFMTPSVYYGRKGIRAAFVNWRTGVEDINIAVNEMQAVLDKITII
ncbi:MULTISPECIES: pyridoxal-dependent decarboxylase [unclassified Arenibacter]|uniref:pyridoxal phosphate-dependent decarboxylase family protein n=1 Tax=unclassified Arenibacter TaxID=2615047 RepID=UPI000E34C1EF|nr:MULTISPECIES: pyridoxal-dependent decarboxylase [unclassified Arenibacter]MCM4165569.1 aspartate aminotransferase family protein [Arenibacter sp. A80]RFT54721.1 aspartate aminotransferase family protein [Arenibacter sp. P308M17]